MGIAEIAAAFSAVVLIVNLILTFVDRIGRSARFKETINKAISDSKLNNNTAIGEIKTLIITKANEIENETRKDIEDFRKSFGDSLPAMREKINQVELWARDEFIRRQDFYRTVDAITDSITNLGKELKERFDVMEGKIDEIKKS